jgi:hypothetical protein
MCDSCLRAVLYGALAHLGSAGADLIEGDEAGAARHLSYATTALLEMAKLDFEGSADVEDLPEEDWRVAMLSFYQARVDHYTDADTGHIIFETHDDDGDPAGIGL